MAIENPRFRDEFLSLLHGKRPSMFVKIPNKTWWFPILSMVKQRIFWVNWISWGRWTPILLKCPFFLGHRLHFWSCETQRIHDVDTQGEAVSAAALNMILISFSVGRQPRNPVQYVFFGNVYIYITTYIDVHGLCTWVMSIWIVTVWNMPFQLPDLGLDQYLWMAPGTLRTLNSNFTKVFRDISTWNII